MPRADGKKKREEGRKREGEQSKRSGQRESGEKRSGQREDSSVVVSADVQHFGYDHRQVLVDMWLTDSNAMQ